MFVGPAQILVAADVSFADGLDTTALDEDVDRIEAKLRERDDRVEYVYVEPEL